VLEYAWKEAVLLKNDPSQELDFRNWDGRTYDLDCGGTLVFDDRGNLLSWSRKPGTEHITLEEEKRILQKKKPTRLEQGLLDDLQEGRKRKQALLSYLAANIRRGLVGTAQAESHFSEVFKPIVAVEEGGTVRFEAAPHLRKSDFDEEEAGWALNY
jgi:hypothetical protein